MTRIHVEGWAPEYGSPMEVDADLAPTEGSVDCTVEVAGPWEPIGPPTGDGPPAVAFVDGVRRVDARLSVVDGDEPPVPGLCGTYAVGAVLVGPPSPATVIATRVEHLAVFGGGRTVELASTGPVRYRSEAVPSLDPARLADHLHQSMRRAEADLAADLATGGRLVIADGPVNDLAPRDVVGYIKSHRVTYLPAGHAGTVGRLTAGCRTPLFALGTDGGFARYSWYVRVADVPHGHAWSGVARCEVPAAVGVDRARWLAGVVSGVVTRCAAPLHTDPRAPQNLVPIAALERHLRRHLGDPGLVYRAVRTAAARPGP